MAGAFRRPRQSDNANQLINNVDRVGLELNQAITGVATLVTLERDRAGGHGDLAEEIALGAGLGGAAGAVRLSRHAPPLDPARRRTEAAPMAISMRT